jgi:acetolactate synthase-1/3 small subunit
MQVTIVVRARRSLVSLNRIVSLLRGRRFAVRSMTLGATEAVGVGHVTLVVDSTLTLPSRIVAYLNKLCEVVTVTEIHQSDGVCRELALIRVGVASVAESICGSSECAVQMIDRMGHAGILQIVAEPEAIERMVQALAPANVIEIVRAGPAAMTRSGVRGLAQAAFRNSTVTLDDDGSRFC